MSADLPKCLRVMADFRTSGIWVVTPHGPLRHGMIEHRALDLPKKLARGFERWIEEFSKAEDAPDAFNVERFNHEGRLLAVGLKHHVGPGTRVLFASEKRGGGLGPEEEIVE